MIRAILRTFRQYYATAHGRHDVRDDARAAACIGGTILVVFVLLLLFDAA
ncbi:hypothetical protein [Selenomonas sp.]|nr:hypothetical protein [Selenomonas sp.]MCI6086770.1 hypothetical protein [Selenomonas sp.]MDY3296570.1 hypothetical protein [Selenomonas sp.]MDY4415425.1 hypothetical protein [Selenomonas sp.]